MIMILVSTTILIILTSLIMIMTIFVMKIVITMSSGMMKIICCCRNDNHDVNGGENNNNSSNYDRSSISSGNDTSPNGIYNSYNNNYGNDRTVTPKITITRMMITIVISTMVTDINDEYDTAGAYDGDDNEDITR